MMDWSRQSPAGVDFAIPAVALRVAVSAPMAASRPRRQDRRMNVFNGRLPGVVFRIALVAAGLFAAYRVSRRYRRFAISGRSMSPTLEAGDWVLVDEDAYRSSLPRRGHVVIAADPRDPARQVVKRVAAVDLHRELRLEGDNPDESTDSRHFGPVSVELVRGRVRWRYWPPGRAGKVL